MGVDKKFLNQAITDHSLMGVAWGRGPRRVNAPCPNLHFNVLSDFPGKNISSAYVTYPEVNIGNNKVPD